MNVDVSSTYIQVLIGLASGIITATLGLSTLVGLDGFNSILLKISLFSFGLSIVSGIIGLGGLVAAIGEANKTIPLPIQESKTLLSHNLFSSE